MKKILVCCLILILLVSAASGSPLIFKATKEVRGSETAELATIDTTKYRQVRISVTTGDQNARRLDKEAAEFMLNSAKRELNRVNGLLEKGVVSRAEYDQAKNALDTAQRDFDNASPQLSIYAVESAESVLIMQLEDATKFRSIVIDSPPSKVTVKVSGAGTYKIFVWASM